MVARANVMRARLAAAANALAIELRGKNLTERDQNAAAYVALAAADAVMFDDAAVERAARALFNAGNTGKSWEDRDEQLRGLYREDARIVIAAITGGSE